MRVEWYGQSAFKLSGAETTVAIDPFGDMSAMSQSRGIQWDYPAISGVEAELLLVTHEHGDHNAVEVIGGDPTILRSTAGTLDSPIGPVTAISSEHDEKAGVERGPNTIFVFEFDGLRIAHMGDFGQSELRKEQAASMADLDLLIVPIGGGFTIGAEAAAVIVERLKPRWVVPMHYRTDRIGFLELADEFLERSANVHRLASPHFETAELPGGEGTLVVAPAAP